MRILTHFAVQSSPLPGASAYLTHMEKEGGEKNNNLLQVRGASGSSSHSCWGMVLSERLAGQSGILSAEENWKNTDIFFLPF